MIDQQDSKLTHKGYKHHSLLSAVGQTDLDTGGQGLSSGSFTSLGGTLERLHSHLNVYAHIMKDVR